MPENELDVREIRKPEKHPTIFATYDALEVNESFVLVNNHNPRHLRDEFEADHPGSYGWEYLEEGPVWKIRITKLSSTPLPHILCDTARVAAGEETEANVVGAAWKLPMKQRDLDSNIIRLAPGDGIDAHNGPDLDVMIHVLAGDGQLTTELGKIDLYPGALVWMPRRSKRQFTAGTNGLSYLTVHQRRQSLLLGSAPKTA